MMQPNLLKPHTAKFFGKYLITIIGIESNFKGVWKLFLHYRTVEFSAGPASTFLTKVNEGWALQGFLQELFVKQVLNCRCSIFNRTSLDDGSPLTLNDGRFDFFHSFLPVGQVLPQRIASGLGQRAADRRPAGQRHLAHGEVLRQRREGCLSPHALSAAAREQPAGLQPDGHAGRPLHGGEHARAPTDRRCLSIYLCFFFCKSA